MMQEVLKRRFWRFRRESQEDGANEASPEVATDERTSSGTGTTEPVTRSGFDSSATAGAAGSFDSSGRTEGEYDESFGSLPDFVIVDGGKGQVSAAHDAMRNLGMGYIPLAGLAKRFEELFVVGVSEPVVLDRTSQALYLVQRIRDEAHRFAITYHRNVRAKSGIRSALDEVPGVGPKRKKALLRKFGSLKAVREATVEEIAATPGFNRAVAEKVLAAL
jgi:excinuclease ABC subunit C